MKKKKLAVLTILLVIIGIVKVSAYEKHNVGEKIIYNGNEFYVIEPSGEDSDYVKLLKAESLTQDEIDEYLNQTITSDAFVKKPLTDINGTYDDQIEIKNLIDNWGEREFGNDAIAIDNYKARLLNLADASSLGYDLTKFCTVTTTYYHFIYITKDNVYSYSTSINYEAGNDFTSYYIDGVSYRVCSDTSIDINTGDAYLCYLDDDSPAYTSNGQRAYLSTYLDIYPDYSYQFCKTSEVDIKEYTTDQNYDWLNYNDLDFWSMVSSKVNDYDWLFHYDGGDGHGRLYYSTGTLDTELYLRPVVNILKDALGDKTDYSKGEEIHYKGQSYYVLYNSDSSKNFVTALKYRPLTNREVSSDGNTYGLVQFYSSDTCDAANSITNGCRNNYDDSLVRKIVDGWTNANIKSGDSVAIDGYKSIILNVDDLFNYLGYKRDVTSTEKIVKTEDTPEWVYGVSSPFWIKSYFEGQTNATTVSDSVVEVNVNDSFQVRPVVYLSKCAIGDKSCSSVCREGTKPVYGKKQKYVGEYTEGQVVTINGKRYIVLDNISRNNKNVKLLLRDLLTPEEINRYNNSGYTSIKGEVPFNYECFERVQSGGYPEQLDVCRQGYEESLVKKIVDSWGEDKFGDYYKYSVLSDNYAFLFGYEETENCYFDPVDGPYCINGYVYNGGNDDIPIDKSDDFLIFGSFKLFGDFSQEELVLYGYVKLDDNFSNAVSYESSVAHILPTIIVDKCALEDGCEYQNVIIGCEEEDGTIIPVDPDEPNNPEEIIDVDNTISDTTRIILFLSFILIFIGIMIIYKEYLKSRKEIKKN